MSATEFNSRVPARRRIGAAMDAKAREIMENLRLAAWARLSAAFGPPLAIAILIATASVIISGQRDAAVQAAEQARLVVQVDGLDRYSRDAFARGQAYQRDLAAMKEAITDMRTELRREIDRLGARLDQRTKP